MASEVLGVGVNRIRIDPEGAEDVSASITREDIRAHIAGGIITAKPEKGNSRGRARDRLLKKKKGRMRGYAHRSGKKTARNPRKRAWITKIRAIRDELKKHKEEGRIDKSQYRKLYGQAKGNLFHSRAHLRSQIEKRIKE